MAVALALVTACRDRDRDAEPAPPEPPAPAPLVERIDAALSRAAGYVVAHQRDDGSFGGELYAAFRSGESLTPLVLAALPFASDGAAARAAYARGVDYVATRDLEELGYPVYALSLSTLVLNAPGNERHEAARQRYLAALRRYQLAEERGWSPDDPSYGGWSYASSLPEAPEPGARLDPRLEANLSVTVFAIGALSLGGAALDDPALARARRFVERCQNFGTGPLDDGGFFFSPVVADSNKAGVAGREPGRVRFRSYGSMTADGVRALLRLGAPAGDPRVQAARRWLLERFDPTQNPGDFPEAAEVRRHSGYYYYAWSVAHALRALGETDWAAPLAEELLRRQRPDGSWKSRYGEMREDEPLVATAFAMAALAVSRSVLTAEYRSHARRTR